jgi:hypothetical protein
MKELSLIKKIKIEEIPNYYITEDGRLCYQTKDNKWMYCKKVDNKPGWVWVYSKGQRGEYNQTKLAIKYIKGYKEKRETIQFKKETKQLEKKDGRYRVGVDKGNMSHLNIPLPLKQNVPTKKLDDRPKQYVRLEQARLKKQNKNKKSK